MFIKVVLEDRAIIVCVRFMMDPWNADSSHIYLLIIVILNNH